MKLKYATPFCVRAALGLKDFETFANQVKQENKEYWFNNYYPHQYGSDELDRRTGRTTKMLVQAVYWSQTKLIYIRGYSFQYTVDLHRKAYEMCCRLDIDDINIYGLPEDKPLTGMRFDNNTIVYTDHYYPRDSRREYEIRRTSNLSDFEYDDVIKPKTARQTTFYPEITYIKK